MRRLAGFALGVEVVEVDQELGDLVEAGSDAFLFVLEQVEGDRVGVGGLG